MSHTDAPAVVTVRGTGVTSRFGRSPAGVSRARAGGRRTRGARTVRGTGVSAVGRGRAARIGGLGLRVRRLHRDARDDGLRQPYGDTDRRTAAPPLLRRPRRG